MPHMITLARRSSSRRPHRVCAVALAYALFFQSLAPAGFAQSVVSAPVASEQRANSWTASSPATAQATAQIVLHPLATTFQGNGAVAHAAGNRLLVSSFEPTGQPRNLEVLDADGTHRQFSNLSSLSGELLVATARDAGHGLSLGGFPPGEVFVAGAAPGVIVRVATDGATLRNPWVTLPGETGAVSGLTVDGSGTFGGDVIAVTTRGSLWRINAAGSPTKIAALAAPLGAVITVANDPARYGSWAGRIIAASQAEPLLYAVDATGATSSFAASFIVRDLAVVPAHENFFGTDPASAKIIAAPADAFTGMVGDVVAAQRSPGTLARIRWNGSTLDWTTIAQTAQWSHIAFSPAGVNDIAAVPRVHDSLAVVRHAPLLDSGRVEGALWQLAAEDLVLDGGDVITADLLVPGSPRVTTASFGGTIEGSGSREPSTYNISIGANATLGHLLTRTDPIALPAVAPPPAPSGTRDVALQSATDAVGSFDTLRNLSISGKAGVVAVPPGTYGALSATGRTALQLGIAGASAPAVYNLDALSLGGGSELRLAGSVVLNVRGNVTLAGSTAGNADLPRQLAINVAAGEVRLSGNAVLYSVVRAPQSTVTIEGNGRLRGTVMSDRLAITGNGVLQVTENDLPQQPVNRPPAVDAGADQTITLPTDVAALRGDVVDDGLPAGGALAASWTLVSGPAPVSFANASSASTTARFTQPGTYVLRLTASDSLLSASDDVILNVVAENHPPAVNAGADQTVRLPGGATLAGNVSDDGLPSGVTSSTWSQLSGPAAARFADASAPTTAVTFPAAGTYVFRLTASDSLLSTADDVAVTVLAANSAPVVDAGLDAIAIAGGNLLVNGGGDAALRGDGTLVGWKSTAHDSWRPIASGTAGYPANAEGTSLLAYTGAGAGDALAQDVDVALFAPAIAAGTQRFSFRAFVRSGTEAVPDAARVIVEYRDAANATVLETFDFGAVASTGGWARIEDERAAPAGTRWIRVRLIATRNSGTTTDAYFDGISLHAVQNAAVLLHGGALDDAGPLTYRWSVVAAPAAVLFGNPTESSSPVVLAAPGSYTLRLTASDPEFSISDDVVITVQKADLPPEVDAGADAAVTLPEPATLRGVVRDDSATTTRWTMLSGPAAATIADPAQLTTAVSFTAAGVYVFRLGATDGTSMMYDEVTVTVTAENHAPTVSAGADQTLRLPSTAALHAVVSDDGNPQGSSVRSTWSVVSGPDAVAIADPDVPITTATFRTAGTYLLRIVASDGDLQSSDDVVVTVLAANQRPMVNAGANQTVTLPTAAMLTGDATDDGVPAPLVVTWSTVSGPAPVTFATPSQRTTAATFAAPGIYVLRLTASDSELGASADVTVTVLAAPVNQAPSVLAGSDQSIAFGSAVTLAGSVSDDGLPSGAATTSTWTMISGPGVVTFGDASRPATTATFTVAGTYVLRLTATDSLLSSSDDVTIVVRPNVVADFTLAGPSRNVALIGNNVASFWTGAKIASVSSDMGGSFAVVYALDDNADSGWRTPYGQTANQSFVVRLFGDAPRTFDRIRLLNGLSGLGVSRFRVDASTTTQDDAAFTPILSGVLAEIDRVQDYRLPSPVAARFLRFVAIDNHGAPQMWLRSFDAIDSTLPGIASYDVDSNVAAGVAGGAVVAASNNVTAAAPLLDGNPATVWSASTAANAWLVVELAQTTSVDRVRLNNWGDARGVRRFRVGVATTDALSFTTVLEATANASNEQQEFVFPHPVDAHYVRIDLIDNQGDPYNMGLAEIAVMANDARVSVSAYDGAAATPEAMLDFASTSWVFTPGAAPAFAVLRVAGARTRLIDSVLMLGFVDGRDSVVKDFDVLVSSTTDDPASFRKVLSATNVNNAQIQTFAFPGGAVRARYVKLVVKSNYGSPSETRVTTFQVLTAKGDGNIISAPLPPPALAMSVVAASSDRPEAPAANAADGTSATWWKTAPGAATDQWIKLALPGSTPRKIYGVAIETIFTGPRDFEVRVSTTTSDDAAFRTVYSSTATSTTNSYFFGGDVEARYVEFFFRNGYSTSSIDLAELHVYSVRDDAAAILDVSSSGGPFDRISLLDNDLQNASWRTADGRVTNESVLVALPAAHSWLIDGVMLQPPPCCAANSPREFLIQTASRSEGPYTTVLDGVLAPNGLSQYFTFPPVDARYVRFVAVDNYSGPYIELNALWVFSPQIGTLQPRFLDASMPADADSGLRYDWSFGDGTTSTERDPLHMYGNPGTYDVSLTVTDLAGQTSRRVLSYSALGVAAADFSIAPATPDEGQLVTFTDASSTSFGDIVRSDWSFGDGQPDVVSRLSTGHVYLDNGVYTVTHSVANARGAVSTSTKTLTVRNVAPGAHAGDDKTFRWGDNWPMESTLFSEPSPVDIASLRCDWSFGDGATATKDCGSPPPHAYAAPGVYTVTLTVTDKDGGSSADAATYTVIRRVPSLIYGGSHVAVRNQPVHLRATLRDADGGAPLAGRALAFVLDGQPIAAVTDAHGEATADPVYGGTSSSPTVTFSFAGDSNFEPAAGSAMLSCPDENAVDAVLVADMSDSMFHGILDVRSASRIFVDSLVPNRDQVGVVMFQSEVTTLAPLSHDFDAARASVDRFYTCCATNLAGGIDVASGMLNGPTHTPGATKVIVLVSDGEADRDVSLAAAAAARATGIRIISVIIGASPEGLPVMKGIASSPADFYQANVWPDLRGIYATLTSSLCTPANRPPTVDAGTDQRLVQPQMTATLTATVGDDGLPAGSMPTTTWTKISGPGSVTFADASAPSTTATFSAIGVYVLRLTASDSEFTRSGDVTISVEPVNQPPRIDATGDVTITDPVTATTLSPAVTDDGFPAMHSLTYSWAQVSGPAAAAIATPANRTTAISFSVHGTYVFRMTVSDSLLTAAADVTVQYEGVNQPPVVDAGTDRTVIDPVRTATLAGNATDDGLPHGATLTYLWTQVGGPATATIATPTEASTAVTLPQFGVYTFRLTASDSTLSAADEVRITLDGVNAAPVVHAGADRSVAVNTPIALAGSVTDDGLPIGGALTTTWSKVSGAGSVAFVNASDPATTVTFGDVGAYVLRLTAGDSSSTASADVTITVVPASTPPAAAITSPDSGNTITDRTTIRGSVSAGAAWKLEMRPNGDSTAASREPWRTIATGNGPLTDAVLGNIDPTLLHNGTFGVRLVAADAIGQTATSAISLIVDGKLKVGIFTLRYRDVSVPLAGPNIDVFRTYDSRDRQSSDFGYGWSLSFTRVHLDKSSVLGEGWEEATTGGVFDTTYCLHPLAPKIVTVTLPDERTYRFRMTVSPSCQRIAPIETPSVQFEPLPGTRARLETVGAETEVVVNGSKPGAVTIVTSNAETYNPAKFRLILPNGSAMVIDEADGLETFTDRNGNTLTFTRDGIEHSTGEGVHFTRDAAGRITAITDPAGKQIVYGYDERGDLRSVTNQENATTRFTYDDEHGLLEIYDPAGRRGIRSEYDENGRLVRILDANGKPVALSYDSDTRQETVIDRKGRTWIYEYDPRGMLLGIAGPHGPGERATYDEEGRCLTSTDRSGRTAHFAYDTAGNLTSMVDRSGSTYSLTYDSSNRLVSITDPKNRTTTRDYDANGNLAALTDFAGHRYQYDHDARGNLTGITDPDLHVRTFGYDARGRRTTETDARGNVTRYAYDVGGHRTTTTLPDQSVIVERYDATGRPIGTVSPTGEVTTSVDDESTATYTFTDPLQNQTQSTSNAEGLPNGVTFPDNSSMSIDYDANGNPERSTWSSGLTAAAERDEVDAPTKVTINGTATWQYAKDATETTATQIDPRGNATTTTFDARGHVAAVTDAQQRQRSFGYDAAGNLTSVTDAAHRTLAFELDDLDRIRRTTSPNGESTSFAHDWRGNVTAITDPLQRVTGYGYDIEGALVSVTEPNQSVSTYERDVSGAITAATDARGETTRYEYDAMGRRTKKIWPDGSSEQYTYLAGQSVATITRRDGSVESYEYDAMGRPTTVHKADDVVSITYTASGRRDVVSSARGSIDYDYDAFDRVVAVRSSNGVTLRYSYDPAGNRTSMTTPAGTTAYGYDSLNRLATVTDPHGHVTSYEYDLAGNLLATTFPNGVRTQNTFDEVGQVVSIAATDRNGASIFDERYERQTGGAIRRVVHGDGSSITYDYDQVSRLVAEAWSDAHGNVVRWIDYGYDAAGNRMTMSDSTASPNAYSYDPHHLFMTGDGHESYSYDARGNVASTGSASASDRYSYDTSGHLLKIAFRAGGEQTYAYDSVGNRSRVVDAAGNAMNEIVDGTEGHLVAQMDDAQQLRAAYIYGHGLISESIGGEEYYYIRDASGSVRALTNAGGAVTDSYDYTAFGVLSASTGSTPNPFRYTGQWFDSATGLYFLHARDYKPSIGRFLQSDSVEGDLRHPQTANAYAYAGGDPVNNVDPTGHSSAPAWLVGIYAHEAVGLYYIARYGDYFWFRDEKDLNRNVPVALVPDGYGWGASNRDIQNLPPGQEMAKKLGLPGLRPDLRHYLTGDVYEVKPYSKAYMIQAWREARQYASTLRKYEPMDDDGRGISWHNGAETMPQMISLPSLEVRSYPFAVEGATLYSVNLRESVRKFLEEMREELAKKAWEKGMEEIEAGSEAAAEGSEAIAIGEGPSAITAGASLDDAMLNAASRVAAEGVADAEALAVEAAYPY